jgi:hypothetical protein
MARITRIGRKYAEQQDGGDHTDWTEVRGATGWRGSHGLDGSARSNRMARTTPTRSRSRYRRADEEADARLASAPSGVSEALRNGAGGGRGALASPPIPTRVARRTRHTCLRLGCPGTRGSSTGASSSSGAGGGSFAGGSVTPGGSSTGAGGSCGSSTGPSGVGAGIAADDGPAESRVRITMTVAVVCGGAEVGPSPPALPEQ